MSNSSASPLAARVADYFFVAGLQDDDLISFFEASKKHQGDDVSYYQRQEQAVAAVQDNNTSCQSIVTSNTELRLPEVPTLDSLLGVLDHVQHVIDNFDKERDTARDNVIAVQDPMVSYKRSESEKTIRNHRTVESVTRSMSIREGATARKWPIENTTTKRSRSSSTATTKRAGSIKSIPCLEAETVPNIFELQYTPTILMRYPKTNYSVDEPFPAYAAMFCFPKDILLHYGELPPPEQLHSFAMTDENGSTVYGTCVVFYEKLSHKLKLPVTKAIQDYVKHNMSQSTIEYAQHLVSKINLEKMALRKATSQEGIRTCQENIGLYKELLDPVKMAVCTAEDVWVPKAIGLLGKMNWMNLYGDWIKILLDNIVGVGGHRHAKPTIDIESTVINLIEEVPLPPPGRFEIGLTINQRPLFFSRPPINGVPLLKNFSLYPVFRALSPHLILAILETLLAEGKVVFISQCTGMLSLVCESFRYLLFPFYWQFVFIPVLPERLLTCLQAPVPYIIGFQGTMDEVEEHAPDDVCIVNLDSNSMHQSQRSTPIPDRQRRKLQSALEQYAPMHTKSKIPYGVPLPVQCAFPKGKLILNCSRSKSTDIFMSPARARESESSDGTSVWSASAISKPSGFWSSNASTRSSNESSSSVFAANNKVETMPNLPQYPGSAMLSTSAGNYAASSQTSLSLQSPPISPITGSSLQKSVSASSLSPKRVSMPVAATSSDQHPYRKANHRRSEPPPKANGEQDIGRSKLSSFMSKPMAVFHQEQHLDNTNMGSPRISISGPSARFTTTTTTEFDHGYHNQVPRRVKHIEGHVMAEIFTLELSRFQGYRCVCGKQVSEDEEDKNKKPRMFMCCQECHLVTHDTCTDEILHPCLPACFNEQKVLDAFIRMFASLLYNYRTGFVDDQHHIQQDKSTISAIKGGRQFSKDKFLKSSDKDTRDFLYGLSHSQMFTQFVTDRLTKSMQEPEILVFDEYIKLKLNRSKLKFVKEDTPFLNDDSYRVSQIIWATPPPEDVIISQGECKRFPTNLQFYNSK